jgi:RNA polymerase sigma-70 factor (ECF subfamily)
MSNIVESNMQEIPEDIIKKASEGSTEAFEMIYNAHSGFVYNVALRMTASREDAQEITQDVFVKIYKNLKWFQFRSSLKTWIYRIAVNAAINVSKRNSRTAIKTTRYEDEIRLKDSAQADNKSADKEEAEFLLNILNPKQRICMVLRTIEGLNYEEIATALNININTVRSRLKRARQKLMAHFNQKERVIEDEVR